MAQQPLTPPPDLSGGRHAGLPLGIIGNCSFSALIDERAEVVWACMPRVDGDPVFHSLLGRNAALPQAQGYWSVELEGQTRSEQRYLDNTAVLVTVLRDDAGNAVEITDFAPRFRLHGRQFRPLAMVRRLRPLAGVPRITVRLRPAFNYGALPPAVTQGSNHVRYVGPEFSLRLTTNAPIGYVLAETAFMLREPLAFHLGPDETPEGAIEPLSRDFQERTESEWREWTRRLALPLEWQSAVIRAAITLKLCTSEETGAIVAALTTSLPEAPGSARNWDYRYCWLRDAFFVVRALNSLSEVETMEHYLGFLQNVALSANSHLQPVFGVGLETQLSERIASQLSGFAGHGPVRVGNQAHEHIQHDVYGNVVLAAAQSFFDERLLRRSGIEDFALYERMGELAFHHYHTPDAGMWELRHRARVHTSSALMCWAACDRLARIAAHLGLSAREPYWRKRAEVIRAAVENEGWNAELNCYVESFGGRDLDAGLLLMPEVGFHPGNHPRILSTLTAIEHKLKRGAHLFRYHAPDDFGAPETAFTVCTFWYLDALARAGRRDEARALFENLLSCRNHLGLLSEDLHPQSQQLWGNFPQTYSMVGIINAAVRLSRDWEEVV
ncbi:glycoside hydrolase family 15 protein [Stagnimonas aquatica]|uniref:Glycoside hydrolase family 15 protein n=1 Tax=Stagnimonas aquatica TaxID=2689987 RepID=A0A3N0VLX8_9GAMM|nr:glycoside hydrolase family 15 protein [Stagnimonas aquatica]ROH93028.1 glycoside hydrolase family 15 protein [Stagnimonas aquatica]